MKQDQRPRAEAFRDDLHKYVDEEKQEWSHGLAESDDGSFCLELFYGKQGAKDSKRLGFVFDEDGHTYYYFISRKRPYILEDGPMEGLDVRDLVHRFYQKR